MPAPKTTLLALVALLAGGASGCGGKADGDTGGSGGTGQTGGAGGTSGAAGTSASGGTGGGSGGTAGGGTAGSGGAGGADASLGGAGGGDASAGAGGKSGAGGTAGRDAAVDAARDAAAGTSGSDVGADAPADTSKPDANPDAALDAASRPCVGLLCDITLAFPSSIKDTGVFLAPPDFDQRPARVTFYVPSPELYSDGLHKLRHVLLPPGTKVDTTNPAKWSFPTGTVFIKTFLDDGPGGTRHPVETRFIRRRAAGYEFVAYRWNAAGTDAALVDNADQTRVPVPATLAGTPFTHSIPSQKDCKDCHLTNQRIGEDDPPRSAFIGFDELRLNSKLAQASPRVQLTDLHDAGLLSALPANPATISDANPTLLRVKRFVFGNCAHCHHGDGQFDLRPATFVANTVGKPTTSSGVTPPAGYLRVVGGDPEKSVLFLQLRGTNLPPTLKAMPPLGVQFPSTEAIADVQAWIQSLPP